MELRDPVAFAKSFAAALHADKGQLYDGQPYVKHLEDVVQVLLRFDRLEKYILTAAYLHDAVEDTGVSLTTIFELFGGIVADLVSAVTDGPGANRKERKAKTYVKIREVEWAPCLKLADRIANVEYSLASGNIRMQKMYRKEYDEFSSNLRVLGEFEPMWGHLQSLILKGS